MTTTLFRASDRGHNNLGWLNSYHTFSFAEYYDPNRIRFGALRVFNDDEVQPGQGFGTHPHDNMEIISIPTHGILAHRDSMGHVQELHPGEVQVMSAGTGLTHSEFNGSETETARFFQIWIFPEKRNVAPRYEQKQVGRLQPDHFTTIVGPNNSGAALWINQHAWMSMGTVTANSTVQCESKSPNNGLFIFVIEGEISVAGQLLGRRDAIGLADPGNQVSAQDIIAKADSQVLVIDVPMI